MLRRASTVTGWLVGRSRLLGTPSSQHRSPSAWYHVEAPPVTRITNQKLEPDYLEPREAMVPVYELLDVRLRSHDFAVLEHYAKWVHRMLRAVGVQVEDCWATPHTSSRVTRLKPNTSAVDATYHLNLYERNVQLSELPSTSAPLVVDLLQHSLPSGVWLRLQVHEQEHDEVRYIPDLELKELKKSLSEVGMDPDKRKRRAAAAAAEAESASGR